MNVKEFTAIKEKIESAKQKKARAEGALAKIEEGWKRDFNINSVEEVKKKIDELQGSLKIDKEKLEALYEKLESFAVWDEV